MVSNVNAGALLLVCVLVAGRSGAQHEPHSQESVADEQRASRTDRSPHQVISQSSLLNPSEGLSVIGAALESRGRGRSKPDCSHLVHTVYERAGFPYSYMSSSDLYTGVDEFHQVSHPQPGDLVVWPGHVGIVVNPSQSTFFSSLRSGIGVESYSSPYWKDRGALRFYRYVKAVATEGVETRLRAADFTRPALDTSVNTGEASSVDRNPANIKLPHVQVIDSARPRPKEITQTLLLTLSTNSEGLRDLDVFKLSQSLIVFSQLEVRSVKIHGDQGRAEVRITAPLSVSGGQMNLRMRQETQKWPLRRRDQKSWEVLLPQDTIYIPQSIAARLLAHQLALLADSESVNLREKSQLSQMLNRIHTQ